MKAVLARTGSVPVQLRSPPISGLRRQNLRRSGSVSGEKISKTISLSSEVNRGRDRSSEINIARCFDSLRFGDRREIGEYYEATLKKNPSDPLLLRNYGKYLHEVVGDWARAEECYGRAILASDGGDGELFSMYGRLIWESQRDMERAKSYFDQAITISPLDCTVLGSYARFIWEAEEDDEDEEKDDDETDWNLPYYPALVPAL